MPSLDDILNTDDFKNVAGINDTTLILQRDGYDDVRLDENMDLIFLSLIPDPPTPQNNTSEAIPDMDGAYDVGGTTYGSRNLEAKFLLVCRDKYDLSLLKMDLMRLFDSKKPFNIIDEDRPGLKWYHLRLSDKITFEDNGSRVSVSTIPMIAYAPYAVSIGTSLTPLTADADVWQVGQNIPTTVDPTYTHSEAEFSIWNLGDGQIDPRNVGDLYGMDLTITFKGPSSGLTIENLTNGDKWQYTGTTSASDTITLQGVFSKKNGASIFGDTNHGLTRLESGENKIKISGTSGIFSITFDMPFLYL
ncbi:phage tail family protein [Sporolactobacillus sp. KGMB 08714]|uniref:phage tail family protein n=1 Tax=Sporolactobacillus sp. KGMB 08714 TaxID=3064704 RepID=UPI002FBEA8C4